MLSSEIIRHHEAPKTSWLHSVDIYGEAEAVEKFTDPESLEALEMGACLYYMENSITPVDTLKFETINPGRWKDAAEVLGTLFHYLTGRQISIVPTKKDLSVQTRIADPVKRSHDITLFSGGLDSYCGLEWLINEKRSPAVVHSMTGQHVLGKAQKVFHDGFKGNEIPFYFVNSKFRAGTLRTGRFPQTRSTLFALNSIPVLNAFEASNLWIPENGAMMINPPPSELTNPTKSTRPFVLRSLQEAICILTGRKVSIGSMFADKTKSEMVARLGQIERALGTYSCFVSRPTTHKRMCGVCYGCNVTRLSLNALGLNDERYYEDPFAWRELPKSNTRKLQLYLYLDLVAMALRLAKNEEASKTTMQSINEVQKAYGESVDVRELMRRFSLDILTGLDTHYRLIGIDPASTFVGKRFMEGLDHRLASLLIERRGQLEDLKSSSGLRMG